jgi:AcrR family transcriptional regulator
VSMADANPDRKTVTYNAPRRAEQAAATRAAIIDAAAELFAERGYPATTMADIAARARVAAKSVYALADKPHLLLLALDRAIVGDDEPVPLADRPEMRAILTGTDPADQARRAVALAADVLLRLYPLYRAFEQAAAAEPALKQAWRDQQRRRREDVVRVVDAVARAGGLRPGLTRERAVDTLWALGTWHPVALLVEERGWTRDDLTAWMQDIVTALLAPPR